MLRIILCDWNGTLLKDRLEETFFFGLCRRAMRRALVGCRPAAVARLLAAGLRCGREYLAARSNPAATTECIARIVEHLDPLVFAGLGRNELDAYTRRYARKIQPNLDRRLLEPLRRLAAGTAIPVGVVSAGCRRGIEAALALAGLRTDCVVANDFRFDGDVTSGFEFAVGDNKHRLLAALLAERGIRPEQAAYIGDSPQDEACFRLVGLPVVSFLAPPAERRRLAETCGAFAPADAVELEAFLRRAIGRTGTCPPAPARP